MRIGSFRGVAGGSRYVDRRRERAKFSPEGYASWRATVPFTDEQFARVYDAEAAKWGGDGNEWKRNQALYNAARCRRGRISGWDLTQCLGTLVKSCAICGKVALYRYASSGRCSMHRLVLNPPSVARRERLNEPGEYERRRRENDGLLLGREKLRQCKRGKR